MKRPDLKDRDYLGDGVYVGHDGHQIVLYLDQPGAYGPCAIALDAHTLDALDRYLARIKKQEEES